MDTLTKHTSDFLNKGKIISVRGSVVDVFFENNLPAIYTLLHTGKDKRSPKPKRAKSELDSPWVYTLRP